MKCTTVILTYNSQEAIGDCLDSLLSQFKGYVLVVDNNSRDKTVDLVKKKFKQVEILRLDKNYGYAGGNNRGIDRALEKHPQYVLILNPDVILLPGAMKHLFMHMETHVRKSILGPKIYSDQKKRIIWSAGGSLDKNRYTAKLIGHGEIDLVDHNQNHEREFVSGTCMLIPQEALIKGMRFFEPYFLYYEDVEFCFGAAKLGYPSYCVLESEIVHTETSKKTQNAKDYYLARNHLIFVERCAPFRVKLHEVVRMPKTIMEHYQNGRSEALQGVRDYFLHRFGNKE